MDKRKLKKTKEQKKKLSEAQKRRWREKREEEINIENVFLNNEDGLWLVKGNARVLLVMKEDLVVLNERLEDLNKNTKPTEV